MSANTRTKKGSVQVTSEQFAYSIIEALSDHPALDKIKVATAPDW